MPSCPPLWSACCQFSQNGPQSPRIPAPPPPFAYQSRACHHTCPFHLCAVPPVCSSSTRSLSLPLAGSSLSLECSLPTPAPKCSAMTGSSEKPSLTPLNITHTQQTLSHPLRYAQFSLVLPSTRGVTTNSYLLVPIGMEGSKRTWDLCLSFRYFPSRQSIKFF